MASLILFFVNLICSSKRLFCIMSTTNMKRKSAGDGNAKRKQRKSKKEEEDSGDSDFDDVSAGSNDDLKDSKDDIDDLLGEDSGLRVPGPTHVGTFLICGATNWDVAGRRAPPKGTKAPVGRNLYIPHTLQPMTCRVRYVVSGPNSAHTILINEAGKVMSFGRNDKGQCGLKDCTRKDVPTLVEGLQDHTFVSAGAGRNHSLFLSDRGVVYACGENKMGQCGVNSISPNIPLATRIKYTGPPIVKVACGADFSMILDCKGVLYSFGSPEYGQLGHGTTGEYIAQSNKVSYNTEKVPKRISLYIEKGRDNRPSPVDFPEIIDIACGTNHSVALDSRKRVFSWGFGGYGRLGHADTKDEMVPRLLQFFSTTGRGVKSVHCGSSYSLAVNEHGMVYLFGLTKKTGEANMYPKPIRDLQGWKVRSVGCSYTSIVVAAEDSVIAFGASPTYGELGLGETRKSTPTPLEVKKLEGIYIEQISCGMCHTVMIARDETDEEKERIAALPSDRKSVV